MVSLCLFTYLHIEALVMVGVAHVSVVKEPHISHVEDLVSWLIKEGGEVLNWLDQITEPDHSWEIASSSLKQCTSELNSLSGIMSSGLYI